MKGIAVIVHSIDEIKQACMIVGAVRLTTDERWLSDCQRRVIDVHGRALIRFLSGSSGQWLYHPSDRHDRFYTGTIVCINELRRIKEAR